MRLKTEVWVSAFLRSCSDRDAMAVVARRGDRDAGMVTVVVPIDGLRTRVYGPPPAGWSESPLRQSLVPVFDPPDVPRETADEYITGQVAFDPDLWVVELEYCRSVEAIDALLTDMASD